MGRASPPRRPGFRAGILAAPLRPRGRSPQGICLRLVFAEAARAEDAPALTAIERACVGSGWSIHAFEREIQAGSSRFVVLRAPLEVVAPAGIVAYCAFRSVADEMEVLSLAVTPEWRRQGLGRWLARLALGSGSRRGALSAFLEVRSGNSPARQLYASLGFAEAGRRALYYRDPVEDALVLARTLAGPPDA